MKNILYDCSTETFFDVYLIFLFLSFLFGLLSIILALWYSFRRKVDKHVKGVYVCNVTYLLSLVFLSVFDKSLWAIILGIGIPGVVFQKIDCNKRFIEKIIVICTMLLILFGVEIGFNRYHEYQNVVLNYRTEEYCEIIGKIENYEMYRGNEKFEISGHTFYAAKRTYGYHKSKCTDRLVNGMEVKIFYNEYNGDDYILYIEQL